MRLDVGCGDLPNGDVNCDLSTGHTIHLGKGRSINPKQIPNFVRCDIHFLPFEDNTFHESVTSHVLEHKGVKPISAIRELVRVTNGTVKVIVPHRFADSKLGTDFKGHARTFNVTSLTKLLKRMKLPFSIATTYRCFPHIFLCLVHLPWEITVTISAHDFSS